MLTTYFNDTRTRCSGFYIVKSIDSQYLCQKLLRITSDCQTQLFWVFNVLILCVDSSQRRVCICVLVLMNFKLVFYSFKWKCTMWCYDRSVSADKLWLWHKMKRSSQIFWEEEQRVFVLVEEWCRDNVRLSLACARVSLNIVLFEWYLVSHSMICLLAYPERLTCGWYYQWKQWLCIDILHEKVYLHPPGQRYYTIHWCT